MNPCWYGSLSVRFPVSTGRCRRDSLSVWVAAGVIPCRLNPCRNGLSHSRRVVDTALDKIFHFNVSALKIEIPQSTSAYARSYALVPRHRPIAPS